MPSIPRQIAHLPLLLAMLVALLVSASQFEARAAGDPCRRPGTPLEAKALAEKAVARLAAVGPEQAFAEFMTPDGEFMPFDLYVFVLDRRGRTWANGAFPELVGRSVAQARDRGGRLYLMEALERADKDGTAWVEYTWLNPCTGKPMAKSSHIIKIGPFFVGVGAYGKLSV